MKQLTAVILLTLSLLMSSAAMAVSPAGVTTPQRAEAALQQTTAPTVHGGNGRITFYAGSETIVFSVYSITGQLLRTVRVAADTHITVELPKGFYIVKCGTQGSRKVVVK